MNNISRHITTGTATTTATTPVTGGRPVAYLGDNNLS